MLITRFPALFSKAAACALIERSWIDERTPYINSEKRNQGRLKSNPTNGTAIPSVKAEYFTTGPLPYLAAALLVGRRAARTPIDAQKSAAPRTPLEMSSSYL